MANIEVHSKKKTTSNSNHAVDLSSVSSPLSLQPSFISERVSASATLLFQFSLLQQSSLSTPHSTFSMPETVNPVSMHSLSSSVSERASTFSHHQSELTGSDLQVLNESFNSDKLSSLNLSASAALISASHYNLCDYSVVNESDAHISYVYVAISIDDIVELITYKQAVKLPLCDK